MSDQNSDDNSDSEDSQGSHKSVETDVSMDTKNKRLQEKIDSLTAQIKNQQKKKDRSNSVDRRSSKTTTNNVHNVSVSLAKKPKLFDVNNNKNINEVKLLTRPP